MQAYPLNEGLSHGALNGLIQPLLSIDEYESKISDKRVIVVAFFVNESAPANDLSNFIDRSNLSIMDTEVSPSPTPDGYYVVFVELERSEDFPKTLFELLRDVDNLTDIDQWGFICPKNQNPQKLNDSNLADNIILNPDDIVEVSDDDSETNESDLELNEADFWRSSVVDRYELLESNLNIYKNGQCYQYKIVADSILEGQCIDFDNSQDTTLLQNLLGPSYIVYSMQDAFVVQHHERAITLQKNS